MVFSSLLFTFFFLPLVLLLYFISKEKYRNYILLLASLLFYAYGEPKFVFVMIASILINYSLALLIHFQKERNAVPFAGGGLFVFKYLDFSSTLLKRFFGMGLPIRGIVLPIGISFFTFQALSYLIDVYRGTVSV